MSAQTISNYINENLPNIKGGTLRFYGDWFGRPMDNYHKIVTASYKSNYLLLHFENKERLFVVEPSMCEINTNQFVISRSLGIVWQWYLYGTRQTEDNLKTIQYMVKTYDILLPWDINADKLTLKIADENYPALEIC